MLPYRLRAPIYGGKLKKEKEITEKNNAKYATNPYYGGGPVQVAIEKDLLLLREKYYEALQQQQQQQHTNHCKKGDAFRVFQTVFTEAKVALLHTHFPHGKVHRGHYTQLIYAACLHLLQQESQHSHSSTSTNDASFAVFCLYALYETNPLPNATAISQSTPLSLLSMGLVAADNPKLRFRRAWKTWIRGNRWQYTLLLQLQQDARALMEDCQKERMEYLEQQLLGRQQQQQQEDTTTPTTTPAAPPTLVFSCRCGMATDVIPVLERVFHRVELCEYSGPGCLEGLAGHTDYPYPCTKPKRGGKAAAVKAATTTTTQLLETIGQEPPYELPASIAASTTGTSSWTQYRSSLQTIRIPSTQMTTQRRKTFQETLTPILQPSEPTIETLLLLLGQPTNQPRTEGGAARRRGRVGRRRVTWGNLQQEEEEKDANHKNKPTTARRPLQTKKPGVVQQDWTYEVLLPEEIPELLQANMEEALQGLLHRDQPMFLPTTTATEPNHTKETNNNNSNAANDDDVSSIGIGGVSIAQSSVTTGQGAATLTTLLGTIANNSNSGTDFLGYHDDDKDGATSNNNDDDRYTSNLSDSEEEEDVMSVATSAVGQQALTTLLSAVSEGGKRIKEQQRKEAPAPKKKQPSRQQTKQRSDDASQAGSHVAGQGKAALATLLTMAQQSEDTANEDGSAAQPEDASERESLVSGQGKAALSNLLAMAQSTTKETKGSSTTVRKRKRNATQRERVETESDAASTAAESHVSGQGNQALANLLTLAKSTTNRTKSPRKGKGPNGVDAKVHGANEEEDAAASLISGQGNAALTNLLSMANSKSTNGTSKKKKKKSQRKGKATKKARTQEMPEELSMAGSIVSSQGRAALENLLTMAQSKEERAKPTESESESEAGAVLELPDDASQDHPLKDYYFTI